jgi:DNA-binding LacI/PurR family transcriptional regulator
LARPTADGPKHRVIYGQLRAEIMAGKYGHSGRLPSESQLGKRFRVSRPTAARALRDLQAQGLVERLVGSGSYVRNGGSAVPLTGDRQIGLLIPGLGTLEFFEVLSGELARMARVHDFNVLWGGSTLADRRSDGSVEGAEELCEQFIQRRVSGVFFSPIRHANSKKASSLQLAERLRNAGIAVVLLDRDVVPFYERSDFDVVGVDHFAGGYRMVQHLHGLGARRMAFVARPYFSPSVALRIASAQVALLDHHLRVPPDFVKVGEPDDLKFVRGVAARRKLDAILCANDQVAAVLLRSLDTCGIRVPEDVRVVGFDDVRYATLVAVPLTTMHQPLRDLGVIAFRTMLDRIADPALPARSIVLPPRLIVRESCGAHLADKS